MIYYKSHNDYWNAKPIYKAIAKNCFILELDIAYINKELVLSHSWRPFRSMTYGSVKIYSDFCMGYALDQELFLVIDLKTSRVDALPLLIDFIDDCKNSKVKIILRMSYSLRCRTNMAEELYDVINHRGYIKRSDEWYNELRWKGISITTLELYKDKPWWKRLNHF